MSLPRSLVLVAALSLSACGARSYTVVMNPENNSGQSGTAVLTELSKSKTRIAISVKASDDTRPQPAHIHPNHCGEIGAKKIDLTSVAPDPKDPTVFVSTTDIDMSFDELRKGPYAINVHDVRDFALYVSCGNTDSP